MITPQPRFLSAYALHPDTGEALEPPALQDGLIVLPYHMEGWQAGYKWALVPTNMPVEETKRYFDGGIAQKLLGIGWEIFDPADNQAAEWELQRIKNALLRQVGKPGRWEITGDTRTLREIVSELSDTGFAADHLHSRMPGSITRLHFQIRPNGTVWTSDEDVSETSAFLYAWIAADERHPR